MSSTTTPSTRTTLTSSGSNNDNTPSPPRLMLRRASTSALHLPDVENGHDCDESSTSKRMSTSLPKSCWEFESLTPMTTRPHFTLDHHHQQQRRVCRAKSLSPRHDFQLSGRLWSTGKQHEIQPILSGVALPQERDWDEQLRLQAQLLLPLETKKESDLKRAPSTTTPTDEPKTSSSSSTATPVLISILYGMINATIVLPVVMSFSTIIYRHSALQPYMPVLTKLTILSSVVHQICFSTFSSLPFAVGSVQDAGLIFLSSMTSKMVDHCQDYQYSDEIMLATVTVGISICTAVLGLGLILLGRWKLAQYVQMLPTCVVGGYLAFIGWFCGLSGLRLMGAINTSRSNNSDAAIPQAPETIFHILSQRWPFILPGILGGILTYAAVRKLKHMAVLPTCILLMLTLFYATLWWMDSSVEQVTEQGWIRAAEPAPVWYKTWDYLQLDKVAWSALPSLLLTELGMIFVVGLSSSLDVAAIELELKRPLNYNRELTTVGISNLLSGLTGGYTGSYIFSQTIFSLRAGIRSRVSGYTLAACQLVVMLLPFPLLSFVPNFFFGSLLVLICVDLLYEWLWDVRTRVTLVEYLIDLATFALIQWLGVEYGIISGVGIYLVCRRLGLDVGEDKFDADHDEQSSFDEQNGSTEIPGQYTDEQRQPGYGSIS